MFIVKFPVIIVVVYVATSSVNKDEYINVACTLCDTDVLSPSDPHYWRFSPGDHASPYSSNNDGHVTSSTNHGSPYVQVLAGDYNIQQAFPQPTYDEVFGTTGAWHNEPAIPPSPSRRPADAFHLPPAAAAAAQLPVAFDDVISGRQRPGYYDVVARPLGQYGNVSISGSGLSAPTHHVTGDASTSSLAVYPAAASSAAWFDGQHVTRYRACAEYRMSRHHVIADFTSASAQCGWTCSGGASGFDDMMWRGKFAKPLEGV